MLIVGTQLVKLGASRRNRQLIRRNFGTRSNQLSLKSFYLGTEVRFIGG